MSLFDSLPKVPNCCFCINLKIACFIICIIELISGTSYWLYDGGCEFIRIQRILVNFIIVCDVVLAIACVVFFIGLILNKQITAEIFLWVTLVSVALKLVASIVGKVVALVDGYDRYFSCHTWGSLVATIIYAIIAIYFMIVVRSHKDEMS